MPRTMMASASLLRAVDESLEPAMSTISMSRRGQHRSATSLDIGPRTSAPGLSTFLFLRDAIRRWSLSKKICMARRDLYVALSSSIHGPAFWITCRPEDVGKNF